MQMLGVLILKAGGGGVTECHPRLGPIVTDQVLLCAVDIRLLMQLRTGAPLHPEVMARWATMACSLFQCQTRETQVTFGSPFLGLFLASTISYTCTSAWLTRHLRWQLNGDDTFIGIFGHGIARSQSRIRSILEGLLDYNEGFWPKDGNPLILHCVANSISCSFHTQVVFWPHGLVGCLHIRVHVLIHASAPLVLWYLLSSQLIYLQTPVSR